MDQFAVWMLLDLAGQGYLCLAGTGHGDPAGFGWVIHGDHQGLDRHPRIKSAWQGIRSVVGGWVIGMGSWSPSTYPASIATNPYTMITRCI